MIEGLRLGSCEWSLLTVLWLVFFISFAFIVFKRLLFQMANKIIPIQNEFTNNALALPTRLLEAGQEGLPTVPLLDTRHRPLRDLRISVTDRCNFRCSYCMPKEVFNSQYQYLPHSALLSFEEISQLAKVFVNNGVEKIRLTGGEPLLRKNIEILIESLAQLRTPSGQAVDLTLTTNGVLLGKKAAALKAAGLQRVTVSLDALDDVIFKQMNDVDFPVQAVLDSIATAQAVGLGSTDQGHPHKGLKVNMVVKKGVNDHQIIPMARHFRHSGIALRFIEFMDVGATNGWRMDDVLPTSKIIEILDQEFGLVALESTAVGETAERYGYKNAEGTHDKAAGEIGFISSVTRAFCKDCNRARISTEGKMYLCLFASQGYDLRQVLRNPDLTSSDAKEKALQQSIAAIWQGRDDHYSELRALGLAPSQSGKKIEMSYIGG